MSLIKCTECGKEISSNAVSCPNCGNPINNGVPKILNEPPVITVQQTYKKWKLVKLFSCLLIIFGLFCLPNGETGVALGGISIFFGFVGLIIGKVGSWWTTG